MMIQQEIQLAVNVCEIWDDPLVHGSNWSTLVKGAETAQTWCQTVLELLAILMVFGLVSGDMPDKAWGNKPRHIFKKQNV